VANEPVGKDDFNRHIDRHDRIHSELDARLARDMVPLPMYTGDQRITERRLTNLETALVSKADTADLQPLKERLDKVEQRPANVRNYLIALAGLGLTLLGIVVSAYFSAKGSG
jgi:tetrahydromethanopterin S-methyltransferase subunit G